LLILRIRNQRLELANELSKVDLALGQLLGQIGAYFGIFGVFWLVFLTFFED
jgi:hypothetical protein